MASTSQTPGYFRALIHLIRPFPDFDIAFIKPLRARGVGLPKVRDGIPPFPEDVELHAVTVANDAAVRPPRRALRRESTGEDMAPF